MARLERLVTTKVTAALAEAGDIRSGLIVRLRRTQETAYHFGADAQTLQVIWSGRRLLGDRQDLMPSAHPRVPIRGWLR